MRKSWIFLFVLLVLPNIALPLAGNEKLSQGLKMLTQRKDEAATTIFTEILAQDPNDLDALWAMAEIRRRKHDDQSAGMILEQIIKDNPKYAPALISLAYMKYESADLNAAQKLIKKAFNSSVDKNNLALCYLIQAGINGKRAEQSIFFGKIKNGAQVFGQLSKAKELAPDSPEVHLGLGTFYLEAPAIIGGNLSKALKEFEIALKLAPDFATVNARLAQAFQKKGDRKSCDLYAARARELDPENPVLKEMGYCDKIERFAK